MLQLSIDIVIIGMYMKTNKMVSKLSSWVLFASATVIVAFSISITMGKVQASHSWNGYHWARTSNPFTLNLGNNLTAPWPSHLITASNDWSASSVLDTTIKQGTNNPKTCKPVLGRVEVCNAKYGYNGWLGLAQIWISGSHITQGTTKMNDTYFQLAQYNAPEKRNKVMCQEIGHTFGLGHQDESGLSLGTCMDYSFDASGQHPNNHDYSMLETIYSHLDNVNTVGSANTSTAANNDKSDLNTNRNWGRRVYRSRNSYIEIYEKQYSDNSKIVTLVSLAR